MGYECLESRRLLTSGSASLASEFSTTQIAEPSEAETLLLYLVNRTRQFPQQWAARLSVSLPSDQLGPFKPVVSNAFLLDASRRHSQEMLSRSTLSHTGANGSSPGDRAVLSGYPTSSVGENAGYDAGYGSYTADAIAQRMNDGWFTSSGHRANMLSASWTEFGGAFAVRQPPGGTQYATELFGQAAAGPFLTGVVFADRNADLDFDANEGLGGVTVTATGPAGIFTTTTRAAGGWLLAVPAGDYIVSATGGTYSGRGSVSMTVGSQSVAVDFISGRPNGWVSFAEYVNAAPTLTAATVSLPPVQTSVTNPTGAPVSGLLGIAFSDPNPLASKGIAVNAATSGTSVGSWQYSIDAGSTWQPLGVVSEGAARLLRGEDLVRFVPLAGSAAGSASISYRAWDQTSGVAGSTASTTTNGGSSAFSTGIATATVATILQNTAPVLSPTGGGALAPIPEDSTSPRGTSVTAIVGTAMSDVDPGTPAGIAVTATTGDGNGAWQYSRDDGVTWVALGAVSQASALLLRGADKLRFVPVANFNGTATISYRAWDQSFGRSGMRLDLQASGAVGGDSPISLGSTTTSVTITPVNDAPTAAAGRSAFRFKPVAVNSSFDFSGTTIADLLGNAVGDIDTGAQTGIALIGLGNGGTWYWSTDGSSWGGGTVSPQFATLLRSTDRLGFLPNSGFSGETTVTFRLWDRTTGAAGFNQADLSNPSATTGGTRAFGTEVLTARIFVGAAGSAPTAAFGAVTRGSDGRTVASIPVTFSRNVEGLDAGDFTLARGGVAVPLTAATLTGSGTSFVLGNLGDATSLQGSYALTLTAALSGIADSSGNRPAANATTTFSVAALPLTPTDISLSATTISENNAAGATVGTFSTTDADSTSFVYTLVSGVGDNGNASFTISGNQLRATASLDFETKSSYPIRVRSTDQGGLFTEKTFTITVTNDVSDDTMISLAISTGTVTEDGATNLVYTFTRTGPATNALTVNYTVGGTATLGTDYTGIAATGTTKTVTFAAGSATATVIVDPTADTTIESDETVALTLVSGTGYTVGTVTPVTGTISNDDLPAVTLAIQTGSVTEDGATNLVYTFTRTGPTTSALTVNYTVGGSATLGTDYTGISPTGTTKTVTFAAGSATATVTVDPTADTTVEPHETVILTLASGPGYKIGTVAPVTGTIYNDDLLAVTLAIATGTVTEDGTPNLVYTFTRTGPTTSALTVNYGITGTADGSDYTGATPGTGKAITFAAGSSTATLTIDPTADTMAEPHETVILTLAAGTGYRIGTVAPVTGVIYNDDLPAVTLAILAASVMENGTPNLVYTFTRTGSTTSALTVNYSITGTANGSDYTGATPGTGKTITFAAGSSTATLVIDPTADATVEADETVILTLVSGAGYRIGTLGPVIGTILNDDPGGA